MNEASLQELIGNIEPVSETWRDRARNRLDTLTKPQGSLGYLEDIAAQFVAIRQDQATAPVRKGVYIFAADHGVTVEGVSAYPSEVTHQMVLNFLAGGAAINVLARLHHIDLSVIDVGVAAELDCVPGLLNRKIAMGTRNMRSEPAMSYEELFNAIDTGIHMADIAVAAGQNVIAIGEMGIGNTTSASAITCALTGASATTTTGRGTGVLPDAYSNKVIVVQETVEFHFNSSKPGPLEILRCVGGLEIAAMVGMILGAARHRLIIIIDGFISTAAAAIAASLSPSSVSYMIAGHRSEEQGHNILLKHLELRPLLQLEMRLGEGSGAVLAIPIVESAIALYNEMATFVAAGVSEVSG